MLNGIYSQLTSSSPLNLPSLHLFHKKVRGKQHKTSENIAKNVILSVPCLRARELKKLEYKKN